LFRKSQYRHSSTGILTTCKRVNVFRLRLSRKILPPVVTNNPMINKTGGNAINGNLGGKVSVTK
jgi:hypothetical protein